VQTTLFDAWQVKNLIMLAGQALLSRRRDLCLHNQMHLFVFPTDVGQMHGCHPPIQFEYLIYTIKGIFCYNS